MHEIIWYGRGGQGVVLASQILAEAAYIQGFRGVTSAPTFGPERRGAPLTASTRIAAEPLRTFSQIEYADIAVVLDESLIEVMDVVGRLKEKGVLIINTALGMEEIAIDGSFDLALVDASQIAREQHLFMGGLPTVNTPLLGALSRASDLVSLDNIERGLKKKMPDHQAYTNLQAITMAYDKTVIREATTE
ncbi:MAG: 2-oxoacid:acceptor oxidoreductase family protein [Deltaproteobacteria bacterium]|jgi:2-oxoacid:acceptor oxidoreductase gamma subunit (pyruvate/2-ketoisovalerate family)|nr:2-oxoacid:acceptor oxidoreductase family protein [Deltaproteobacteria bacterium]